MCVHIYAPQMITFSFIYIYIYTYIYTYIYVKGKVFPLQARCGPEGG